MPLLVGCRPCPGGVRICATSPVAAAAATAAASSRLHLTRRARSHHPPLLQFSPPGTHHPLLFCQQQRVYTALSPSRAFSDRMHRSLHPNSILTTDNHFSSLVPTTRPTTSSSSPPPLLSSHQPLKMGQHRTHAGHSHGHHHHHHHDNVYLTSQNKNDAGVRITRIGLYSNLGMAIAKGAGGYLFNSQAMVADAWHSLTDLASDVLTLATVSWSLRPPTDNFPLGFGKVESLGSLGVSSMLLFGGIFMGMSSCETLWAHFFLDPAAAADMLAHGHGHGHSHIGHSHGHSHGGGGGAPSLHAAWLAAGTVAIKEWLYHATMKVARDRKSSVLASNAVHHRVDSLTGIVTLLAILGANFLSNAAWLDPVGGLLISLLVIRAGITNTLSALYELADRSIDEEVRGSVEKQVAKSLTEINHATKVELTDVSGVKSGQNYLVDLELAVPKDWTVEEVRQVEEKVRERVGGKVRGVRRVRVRFVPHGTQEGGRTGGLGEEFISGEVSARSSPEPEEENGHAHEHNHSQDKKDL
ncbi:cation efflux family-domain-containing protein [Triangularia setosa]|uniref:Cation efflux family-domain-containing protein n=1 Tax=Triangularia setosa TaxID=2587417 RepID=A0AAN6WCU9_9PEZI|nr:cation efflux family-domain-containing protein [Podospora setosa]